MEKMNPYSEPKFSLIAPQEASSFWNDDLEIVFFLKGEGWLRFGDSNTTYTLCPKDVFVVNRYQLRILTLKTDSAALAMYIPPSLIASLCPEQSGLLFECKSFLFPKNNQDAFNAIRRDFAQTFEAYYKKGDFLPVTLRSLTGLLLADLIRFFPSPKNKPIEIGTVRFEHLRTITEYIHAHYKEDITLGVLASNFYLSTSYISHLFKKQLGQTFTEYLTDVRLSHAAVLLASSQSVTDIAIVIGFANSGTFIDAFKQRYGITPGRYRKQHQSNESTGDLSSVFSDPYGMLIEFIGQMPTVSYSGGIPAETCELSIDISQKKGNLRHKWRTLLNAGYAKGLRTLAIRRQLEQIQREIGYEYIRFKGCLDDELMTCIRAGNSGEFAYNFVIVDECIDVILSMGAKPWLELNHVPTCLAPSLSSEMLRDLYPSAAVATFPSNMPPESLEDWLALIKALFLHLIERYSSKEVEKWIFLPFVSLSYHKYSVFTKDEYWALYRETVGLLRGILSTVKIAGANISINETELTKWFLERCKTEGFLPDILAMHSFSTVDPHLEDTGLKLLAQSEALPEAVSEKEKYIEYYLRQIRGITKQLDIVDLPIVLSEWNSTIWQRDLCNDTCYKSAYIFKNILENYDNLEGMGYWSLSDNTEEILSSYDLFHGGFGLFTRTGLPKSAYRALGLINKIGNTLISKGDGFFVTADENCIQVYLYNYAHYDTLYRYRHTPHQTFTDRYNVFNICHPRQYHIRLNNIEAGRYSIRKYSIGAEGGSVYDAWINMGAPKIRPEVHEYLEHLSYPNYSQSVEDLESKFTITSLLHPHEVQLITLTKE